MNLDNDNFDFFNHVSDFQTSDVDVDYIDNYSLTEEEIIELRDEDIVKIQSVYDIHQASTKDFDKEINAMNSALSLLKNKTAYRKSMRFLNIKEAALSKHVSISETAFSLSLFSTLFPAISHFSENNTGNSGIKISDKYFPMSKFLILQNLFISVLTHEIDKYKFYMLTGFTFEEFKRYMPPRIGNMKIQKSKSVKNFMQYFM